MYETLRRVRLFAGLDDEHLEHLCGGSGETELAPGEELFAEGDVGDSAYVITEGEFEILKRSGDREVLVAVRSPPDVIGEMALLEESPRTATARARTRARVVTVPKPALDELLAGSTTALRSMLETVLDRLRESQERLRQGERMQQLGTLSAGVAHELNNPASAVQRGAAGLRELLDVQASAIRQVAELGLDDTARTKAEELLRVASESGKGGDLSGAASDSYREAELEDWLDDHDVAEPWELTAGLIGMDVAVEQLEELLAAVGSDALQPVLRAAVATHDLHALLRQIDEGAQRIVDIVGALKSYSYLDQAPLQGVDVTAGIDDTLLILGAKVRDITIRREYDPDTPRIEAYGSELNQVWTNLIDNAADALHEAGTPDPTITIRAFPHPDGRPFVVVEVEDDGPGMPEEVRERVFDRFFTTKPPGSGTGLGLDTTQRIVVLRHRGDIAVTSEPGRTVFRVELPISLS